MVISIEEYRRLRRRAREVLRPGELSDAELEQIANTEMGPRHLHLDREIEYGVPLPSPEPGLVISFSYLRRSKYEQGREEGGKNRPCAVILTTVTEDADIVVSALPITHAAPPNLADAIELPLPVKKRLGLDDARSWVIVSEMNRFVWPGSRSSPGPVDRCQPFRLRPSCLDCIAKYGSDSRLRRAQRRRTVTRTE